MKNVAKIEIVLHDPYSNALWGGAGQGLVKVLELSGVTWSDIGVT